MMTAAQAERIKDLASIQGVRPNQLIGYGIVVGLDGSGDQTTQTPFTVQSINTMLSQMGIQLPPGQSLQLRNVASVMVTAQLPAFARPGQTLDVTVSSMGNARSLRGGTLLMTPLKGADGNVYALAQGNLVVAGAGAASGGNKAQVNHLNAGRIPNGALVERAVASPFAQSETVQLELLQGDFSNAIKIAQTINQRMGQPIAAALDARLVQVIAPPDPNSRVAFMAEIENLEVEVARQAAKVIVNARTGSVVMNQTVILQPCAISHGNLSITISNTPQVSQPNALSPGQTTVTNDTNIQIKADGGQMLELAGGTRLADVVKALNTIGTTPQDLLAILQALKSAGSLRAELEII
ncbi:flagellar basal body P-ring protein FlgI [Parvibium lacunae]|uniref:Flagellar P-ring protein n=2 Tax=Parvibium lacunae TaxID=1888893 RepID=A0A368L593_9BURK|nr:flagellar basal body P-ring protein FlgI [Parvibium lacunae]RCS58685.1 flagellar basal body P-ring protein FlgI [Parvibium lacunae]